MSAPNPYFLKLTESETLRFLELYEKEEILWNAHLEMYRNRAARFQAAQRVSEALNVRGFTAEYVFIKFKNLRSSYCQELKKIAESISSGAGEIYRPKVFWFHTMNAFLRPFVQSRAAQSNLYLDSSDIAVTDIQTEEVCTTHFMNQSCDLVSSRSTISDEPIQFVSSWEANDVSASINYEKQPPPAASPASVTSKSGYSKRIKLDEVVKSDCNNYVITDLSNNKNPITAINLKDDSFECFGKYIASLLRNMPTQKAYRLQLEIATKILHEQIEDSDEREADDEDVQEDDLNAEKGDLVVNGVVKPELVESEYVDLTTEINYENY